MELSGLPGKRNGAPGACCSPASPGRKLDLRLGKEERRSEYGAFRPAREAEWSAGRVLQPRIPRPQA